MSVLLPEALVSYFAAHPKGAVALSGGVDSAFLLYAAKEAGADMRAYTVHSPFQPAFERADARRAAKEAGVPLTVLTLDVLDDPVIAGNPPDRCYYCKRRIFAAIAAQAVADGYDALWDGTNASDDAGDRPGMRALAELAVCSPLRICGVTKTEIRAMSREAGLFAAGKPSYACLATRIPTGMPVTAALLERVERAENALFALGYTDFRVRVTREGGALLQLLPEQLMRAQGARDAVCGALAPWFSDVTIDATPRVNDIAANMAAKEIRT